MMQYYISTEFETHMMMIFAKVFNVIENVLSRLSSTQVGTLDRNGAFGWKNIYGEKVTS